MRLRDLPAVPLRGMMLTAGALGLAACVAPSSPPQVVEATQPTVSYEYTSEDGLLQATQQAEAYCQQFRAWPEAGDIRNNDDGSRTVEFVCNRSAPPPAPLPPVALPPPAVTTPPMVQPSVAYTVTTDTELVAALRSASAHCRQRGLAADTLNVTPNTDGSRTVSFRCVAA